MALFKNTDLFSPVSKGYELPMDNDLFFFRQEEIPLKENKYESFLKGNGIEIDDEFWFEQDRRCREGYEVEDALTKGGDAIVDGRDAIWNETAKPWDFYNENFDKNIIIPPETVYLTDADLLCPQGTVRITGRHYFYLNFWKILSERGIKGEGKDYYNPMFTDIDFLKAYRIALQIELGKDNSEAKARQLGFSKSSSGMILGYNMLFIRSSVNVIVAGNDEDAKELFETTYDGIMRLTNSQFFKVIDKDAKSDQKLTTKYFNSKLYGFTAGAKNDQVLSRLTPYWVIYEEVGKWSKGLVQRVQDFVEPSIITRGNRTGYQTFIGTGGDMEMGADDMEKIHYSGSDQYLRFKNKFERNNVDGKSGWFSGKWWFTVVDENGNSNMAKGIEYVKNKIEEEKDPIKRYIKMTQWALYAQDAFQMSVAGFFGEHKINMLNARLSEIKLNKNLQIERYGILEWKDKNNYFKGVNFIETDESDAFVVIIEEPLKDKDGNDIINLYEIGIDSYDMDESMTSTSKGSAVVRKKFLDSSDTYDLDVAMILERPKTNQGGAPKFFEHCAMLSVYYNKSMMTIEHTKIRIFDWLELNGFGALIALRPVLAFANVSNKSNAMNKYGVDGSMKPHIMAMLAEKLTEEFIQRMFLTKQIIALANYKYSRNYNCDITVATAHANVAAKESQFTVAKSSSERKDKTVKHSVYIKKNGVLQKVFV